MHAVGDMWCEEPRQLGSVRIRDESVSARRPNSMEGEIRVSGGQHEERIRDIANCKS